MIIDKFNFKKWNMWSDTWAYVTSTVTNGLPVCNNLTLNHIVIKSLPEFTIVIFIHYKPRIAAAIHDL